MKNFLIIFVAGLVIVGGVIGYGSYYKNKASQKLPTKNAATSTVNQNTTTAGGVTSAATSGSVQKASGFTLADIAPHNSETSCWMAIDGSVYDVTSFVAGHPGGRAILRGCGTDASIMYANIHDSRARSILPQYKIGALQK